LLLFVFLLVVRLLILSLLLLPLLPQPTLLKGTNNMQVFQEEIFGPVAAVTTFKTTEEAIAIANDTIFGLGGKERRFLISYLPSFPPHLLFIVSSSYPLIVSSFPLSYFHTSILLSSYPLILFNDTKAGVWSRDAHEIFRVPRAIKAGRVWVNCYHNYTAGAPFGGQ
jgi:hypothetical protein